MTPLALQVGAPLESDAPILGMDDLLVPFYAAEKPRRDWRIGCETERFGVGAGTGEPVSYDGSRGVVQVLGMLESRFGWEPFREGDDGPLIGLRRGEASITLEPGAQLELSGAPAPDVHCIRSEMRDHLSELHALESDANLAWLATGFHPLAALADLPRVPKLRYAIMRQYLPPRGDGALDMMWRTATVQANFDYSDETDALRKVRVSLALSPLVQALLANSPFRDGEVTSWCSQRGATWLRIDGERSGLVPSLWSSERPGYRDYVEWALDAGMFLFMRNGTVVANTGQTFRSFLTNGFCGHRPTLGDWKLHLNTLFPEVRLKNTIEVRCADALPTDLACALPALFTGILYDEVALAAAEDLVRSFRVAEVQQQRSSLVRIGLRGQLGGHAVAKLAERVVEIAAGGLARRARVDPAGRDEGVYLEPIAGLLSAGRTPADRAVDGLRAGARPGPAELIARTRA